MTTALASRTRRLVSQDDAAMIEDATVPRSRFSGSWSLKTAFDAGQLIPILVEEVLPGDHLSYGVTAYVRLSTPLFPIFDQQRVDTFFFFVPSRLLWENFVKMMGEQDAPGDSIDYTIPQIVSSAGGFPQNSIYDYMGIPVAGQIDPAETISVNALPLRAYQLIYHEWFRDQNIITDPAAGRPPRDNGPDLETEYLIWYRAKSHDYFTSALPWAQKFTAPTVPVAGQAPVLGIGFDPAAGPAFAITGSPTIRESDLGTDTYQNFLATSAANAFLVKGQESGGLAYPAIYADLSQATGVAINTFRQAFMVQALLERDARGGTRYVEQIRSHFRVTNPDFRLQRPEYIGGGQTPLNITPIAQTAPDATSVVGALGAAGAAAGNHRASYAATEHGYILGLINVRTELSYQQGLHPLWTRTSRLDFPWPSLAGLGEQAILQREIYATGVAAEDETVFGYQERWHEWRTRYSHVTGIMRSTHTGTLDAWHLAQRFDDPPVLNATFLEDVAPMDRILAAGALATGQQYLADIMFERTAVRPIPLYGTPVLLGRF